MHRQIARVLLILLLVSIFTPLALAISTPAPHACCMRKPLHARTTHDSQFNAPASCCGHDCCRPLTRSCWAHVRKSLSAQASLQCDGLESDRQSANLSYLACSSGPVRAPPQFSLA
jgi:hypothetical protein